MKSDVHLASFTSLLYMNFINYNGKIYESSTPIITAGNRGLRYGDGLFETIRCKNGSPIFIDEHLSRLWNGLKLLNFEIPKLFSPDLLEKEINAILLKNKLKDARIRLSVFKGQGGLYDPENAYPNYLLETFSLKESSNSLNQNGLQCGIFSETKKIADKFSNIKHNNFLPYILGAAFAKKNRLNDAIILNEHNNICDSTLANIFIVKNKKIYTPALSEGCIAGVMRNFVIQSLRNTEWSVTECTVTSEFLYDADEVFFTNAIRTIRWVAGIDDHSYGFFITSEVFEFLKKTNPNVIC
jgi:branched-chain amino acid aminotransferase